MAASAQKYKKTQGVSKPQQKEFRRISHMPFDSLKLGFAHNFDTYKTSRKLVHLYLCNNYANELTRYQGAFDPKFFSEMRNIAENKGDTLTDEYAATYTEEALYYYYARKLEKSQELNITAYNQLKKIKLKDYLPMVNMVYKIAYVYKTMGELEKSFYYAKVCIKEARKHKIPVLEAGGYLILGENTMNTDARISRDFLLKGLKIANGNKTAQRAINLIRFFLAKINAYFLKEYKSSIQYADSALIYYKGKSNCNSDILNLLQCKAISYYHLKDSIKLHKNLLQIDTVINSTEIINSPKFYRSLKAQGNTNYVIKDYRKAEILYEKSLKEYKAKKYPTNNPDISGLYSDRGRMLINLRDFEKFDKLNKEATPYFTKGMPFDTVINTLKSESLGNLQKYYNNQIYALCENKKEIPDIDSLLNIYKKEYKLVKTIFNRFNFSSGGILKQTNLLKRSTDNIQKKRILCQMNDEQKKKFWMISSSLKTFDLINQKRIKNYSSNKNSEFRRLKNRLIRTKVNDSLYNAYFDEYISFCMDHYLNGLSRKESKFDLTDLDQSYQKTEKLLKSKSNNLILDLYKTDSIISICTIQNGHIDYKALPFNQKLEEEFNRLNRDIKSLNYKSNVFYQELNLVLTDIFDHAGKLKKVNIIADEELLMFPFELIEYKNKLLIESIEISYNYSPYLLQESIDNTSREFESILAIAPGFEKSDITIAQALRDDIESLGESADETEMYRDQRNLAPLPYTIKEVQAIYSKFKEYNKKGKILLEEQATEQALRKEIGNFDIIHFATHGYSSKKEPGLSRLILATGNDSNTTDENNDALLYMDESYELPLNADLVVLSACKTGVGKIIAGEGIMALPRGFIYAGVPNIIASLWKVHDQKTKVLMEAFYKHLLEDKCTYSEALRFAKLDCIKKGYLPLDWSGFILIGN